MKTRMRNMILIAALAALTVGGVSSAHAQDNVLDKMIASAEYQQADIREALKTLFRQVDANYSILPEVQGTVTINMKNARFELVLQNLLNQVNATFRYEAGVFVIVPRPAENTGAPVDPNDTTVAPPSPKITRKIYIRSMDPMLMAMLIGQTGQNFNGSPEPMSLSRLGGGGMGGGGMMGGMGGGMGGGMMGGMGGGGMMGGMGGGMGGGMMGGMGGGGMMGGMGGGGMGGGMNGGF